MSGFWGYRIIVFWKKIKKISEKFEKIVNKQNSFYRVINAVKILKENNFLIRISCPIASQNFYDLKKLCNLSKNLGVLALEFGIDMSYSSLRNYDQFRNNYTKIENWLKKLKKEFPDVVREDIILDSIDQKVIDLVACGSFTKNFAISPSGNVKPCVYFPENSIFNVGKLSRNTLSSKKMFLLQNFISGNFLVNSNPIKSICENCDFRDVCGKCFYKKTVINETNKLCKLSKEHNFSFKRTLMEVN